MNNNNPSRQKSLTRQLEGLWQLLRPANVWIGGLSIGVGAWVTGLLSPFQNVLLACFSGALITGAANTINDFYDIEIDRINKPARPLPSGKVSPQTAFFWAIFLFIAGVGTSLLINKTAFWIASTASVLLFFYSYSFKRLPLIGNFTVSLVAGLAFIYGGVSVGRFKQALIPATFAFLFHFGREILKDIEDISGDRAGRARTFPICCGVKAAQMLITFIFFLLISATFLPYLNGEYNLRYFLIVLPGVDLYLLYVIFAVWRNTEPANLHKISTGLKIDMLDRKSVV